MVSVDRMEPIRFLRTAYDEADWIAVFLKTYRTGEIAQRVLPVSAAASPHFQAWLRHRNANGWNVYVAWNQRGAARPVADQALDRCGPTRVPGGGCGRSGPACGPDDSA